VNVTPFVRIGRALAALFLLVGTVLLPLHAAAATLPTLIAYDEAVPPSATTGSETERSRRPERGSAPEYGYDAVRVGYDSAANLHVVGGARAVLACDDASAATPATKGIGEVYQAYSNALVGQLGQDGILDLFIKVGEGTPRGGEMFNEALEAFGSNVKGIRGDWAAGGDMSANFDSFTKAVQEGVAPETAALENTFTGKMAARAGFTSVRIVSQDANSMIVEFTQ
jgi:hypothetical protein